LSIFGNMQPMQDILSNLASVFRTEIDNYRELLKVLNKEQKVLLEDEISKLADFVNEENEIIHKIKNTEAKRDELIDQLSEMAGISTQEVVFSKLIELAPEPSNESFSEISSEIEEIAREFKTVNQCNRDLINSHREYVRFIVGLISEYDDPGRTYREDGELQKRESMSLLNKQV